MLDERSITVAALARAPMRLRFRRLVMSLAWLLALLAMGTGAAYQAFMDHPERTKIRQAALLPAPGVALGAGETVPTRDPGAGRALNILLVGSDRRGTVGEARADIIVLAHLSDDGRKVALVHFPGNMYVDVPGFGKDRIHAAYTLGGPQLLVRTVQKLVNVRVDHVGVIGFAGFKEMTDAFGGLDVYAEKASTRPGAGAVRKGRNRLDGSAAVTFLRERRQPGESDISRGRRQLAFIKAIMLKSLNKEAFSNRIVLAEFRDAAIRNITVDNTWSMEDMRSQASALQGLASRDIACITAPIAKFGKGPKGAAIDIVNVPRMAQLSTALRGDDLARLGFG